MWLESFGDRVGLGDGELGHIAPLGSSTGKGARDMEVDVGHGLVCRDPIVLPHGDTFGIERADDGRGRSHDVAHHCGLLVTVQVDNGLAVPDGDDEEVIATALIVRNEQGAHLVSFEDRVGLVAGELFAE